jgi:hypothetical protein
MPTHGSLRNPADIEIGIFSQPCFCKRTILDLSCQETRAWNRRMNRARGKITWVRLLWNDAPVGRIWASLSLFDVELPVVIEVALAHIA